MTDDIDIRSGGAIAVDTDTLRRVAARYAAVAEKLDDLQVRLNLERARLMGVDLSSDLRWRADRTVSNAGWACENAAGLARRLDHAAAVYEIVEVLAQRDAADLAGDEAAATAAEARLRALVAGHPFLAAEASLLLAGWWSAGPGEIARQAGASPLGAFGQAGLSVFALALAVGVTGRGRIARNAVLTGPAPPVVVNRVERASTPAKPPTSLTSVIDRMPQGQAQVRVERYAMPDGRQRFAVYITGTRSMTDIREPWNMDSNEKLYAGQRSASYEATVQALRDAGARPGDAVYEFGHSQGGMIASQLALQEGYDVHALVTFGAPVSADVGPDTLSVQLRHIDDPVVALADGGNPGRVGAEGSFIAERVADPAAGVQDVKLAAHGLDAYRETAAMVDASSDSRADALGDVFDELGAAESVEVLEYAATNGVVLAPAPSAVLTPTV